LEGAGLGPQWQAIADSKTWQADPYATGLSSAEIIKCTSGPIRAIELRSQTANTGGLDLPNSWRIVTQIGFAVNADWPKRWIPGLHRLLINLPDARWIGNDIGLGLIEQLNKLPASGRTRLPVNIEIKARTPDTFGVLEWPDKSEQFRFSGGLQWPDHPTDYGVVEWPQLTYHSIDSHEIILSFLGEPSGEYSEGEAASPCWPIPSDNSIHEILSVAQLLVGDPPNSPLQVRPPEILSIPAPSFSYIWWLRYPVAAFSLTVVAFSLLFLAGVAPDWAGWIVFLGFAIVVLSFVIAIGSGLSRLNEIRRGCKRIVGIVERKWTSPDHHFIRVEGLPFVVESSQYRRLSEGNSVVVTFWPSDKRIESIRGATTPRV